MAPFRGRGGRGRGGRGGRGGTRGGSSGKLARSGIRTKHGYKKFDSQRVRDVDESDDQVSQMEEQEDSGEEMQLDDDDDDDTENGLPKVRAYNALLQSFHQPSEDGERKPKRRKIERAVKPVEEHDDLEVEEAQVEDTLAEEDDGIQDKDGDGDGDGDDNSKGQVEEITDEEDNHGRDPFEDHFAHPDEQELSICLKAVQSGDFRIEKRSVHKHLNVTVTAPKHSKHMLSARIPETLKDLPLKERLNRNVEKSLRSRFLLPGHLERMIAAYVFSYQDLMVAGRNLRNAVALRGLAGLHAVNHILKGRDKVIKNNERLNHADKTADLDLRDQGFVRPKVLILLETRQMAAKYANAIVDAFLPDQQENRKRFDESFTEPVDERETMPEDYRELFGGNNDNSFMTALKFTRKTLKFYSAFYNSDIIIASALGLRRVIENEDVKKRDHDFLSSIEVAIIDQADAMQMQNWENVELVFRHLNLELKEAHGCDFSRVRNWCLDGNAKHLRQTIVFSAYITPELNSLYNTRMQNVAGKVKITPTYAGAIAETSGLGIKQTFSRFDSPSPASDPDFRFKFFTTAILPTLLRLPKPADGAQGILVFIPTYYDFLRLRNFFATSAQTANVSFGAIHDYSEVSDQRRARSHFLNGRHSILLYTQRAHHFFRLKIRGVKKVVMYGVPDNAVFYQEMVEGFLGTSMNEGKIDAAEASVRAVFSKWDGLRMEKIVGTGRVKAMLGGVGDVFDFV